jgi:hypothetical protein
MVPAMDCQSITAIDSAARAARFAKKIQIEWIDPT